MFIPGLGLGDMGFVMVLAGGLMVVDVAITQANLSMNDYLCWIWVVVVAGEWCCSVGSNGNYCCYRGHGSGSCRTATGAVGRGSHGGGVAAGAVATVATAVMAFVALAVATEVVVLLMAVVQ